MKVFAVKEKRFAPAIVRRRPYVHAPFGPVQRAQQAWIGRILRSTGAQARLTIGQPNDRYEQEADRVADKVMAMPDPMLHRQPEKEEEPVQAKFWYGQTVQRMCPECKEELQRQPAGEEDEELQAKGHPGETPEVTPNIQSRIHSMKSGGQPLDIATRAFFEPRFGHDFSHVRIHHGGESADVSRSISARAFTLGNNVVFGSGQYHPESSEGRRLLGHELMHVVQQRAHNSHVIARQPTTPSACTQYNGYNRSVGIASYNCAGLALRDYVDRYPASNVENEIGRRPQATCGEHCDPLQIKYWLWTYKLHFEYDGQSTTPDDDFHIVAGKTNSSGADPRDVYSKNGHRPVYGPNTGPSFRPPSRERATYSEPSERPVYYDRSRRRFTPSVTPHPVTKVRTGMNLAMHCTDCP